MDRQSGEGCTSRGMNAPGSCQSHMATDHSSGPRVSLKPGSLGSQPHLHCSPVTSLEMPQSSWHTHAMGLGPSPSPLMTVESPPGSHHLATAHTQAWLPTPAPVFICIRAFAGSWNLPCQLIAGRRYNGINTLGAALHNYKPPSSLGM